MKKIVSWILIALLGLILAGCANGPTAEPTAEPTEPEPQAHTIAPSTPVEPEWAPVDCALTLEDNDNLYAEGEDFRYFALIGTTDEDCELRFMLDEVTAAMLREQNADNAYFITVNGTRLGNANLNEDCTEASVKGQLSYDEMTAMATTIRGL